MNWRGWLRYYPEVLKEDLRRRDLVGDIEQTIEIAQFEAQSESWVDTRRHVHRALYRALRDMGYGLKRDWTPRESQIQEAGGTPILRSIQMAGRPHRACACGETDTAQFYAGKKYACKACIRKQQNTYFRDRYYPAHREQIINATLSRRYHVQT